VPWLLGWIERVCGGVWNDELDDRLGELFAGDWTGWAVQRAVGVEADLL